MLMIRVGDHDLHRINHGISKPKGVKDRLWILLGLAVDSPGGSTEQALESLGLICDARGPGRDRRDAMYNQHSAERAGAPSGDALGFQGCESPRVKYALGELV